MQDIQDSWKSVLKEKNPSTDANTKIKDVSIIWQGF